MRILHYFAQRCPQHVEIFIFPQEPKDSKHPESSEDSNGLECRLIHVPRVTGSKNELNDRYDYYKSIKTVHRITAVLLNASC